MVGMFPYSPMRISWPLPQENYRCEDFTRFFTLKGVINMTVLERLEATMLEQVEVFYSMNMMLQLVDPELDMPNYLRVILCVAQGKPENTPKEQLESVFITDLLPVYIERVRRDYGHVFDIDEFVTFIITELRAGRLMAR